MNNKINFDFVSPEASIVSSEVEMVLIPGIDGDAGILPNHSPFMTTLRQGIVEVTFEEGNVKKYLVDSNTLKNEIEIINEKLVSAVDNEKILLDERKSLIEDFI